MAEARTLPTETIVPSKFAHVVLRCRHFKETRDWYTQFVGAHVVFENEMIAFMTFDDEHHRLALVNLPDAPEQQPGQQGVEHYAYTLGSLGELLGTYRRLKAEGIEPYWCINHGPTTSMYFRDPDGNQVELQVDNFEKLEEVQGWFTSETFRENPIGIVYDPERLIERYERGDPLEELVQQGSA